MRAHVFNAPDYLALEAERLRGTPVRLSSGNGPLIGLVARQVPRSCFCDGISVYGYPDLDQREPRPGRVEVDHVLNALRRAGAGHNLICAYFRLGLGQEVQGPQDTSLAQMTHIGDSVIVDLQRDWQDIFSGFRRQLRNALRHKSDGIVVTESDDIAAFHSIYLENMRRVQAHESYFFSLDYLRRLLAIPGVGLFIATDDAGPIAGALIVAHGDLLFYHLAATADRALARSPVRIILAEVVRRCTKGPFRRLVLGGGRGGQHDSLLEFKRGFSKQTQPVYALKVILDPDAYAELSGRAEGLAPFTGFFPAYRDPARQ
jgi:hypothetical protein